MVNPKVLPQASLDHPMQQQQQQQGIVLNKNEDKTQVSAVDTVENEFLQGNFRQALARGNRLLLQWRRQQRQGQFLLVDCRRTTTFPIHSFTLWNTNTGGSCHELKVHVDDGNSSSSSAEQDRVGAVVLQAWYELWKRQQKIQEEKKSSQHVAWSSCFNHHHDHDEARKHLTPFLEAFCSGNHNTTAMSVELAWMWLQFLWTIGERPASVMLALHLLKFVQGNNKLVISEPELYFLVCTALPHLTLGAYHTFWDSWYKVEGENIVDDDKWNMALSPYPTKEALDSLTRVLPSLASQFQLSPALSEQLEFRLESLYQHVGGGGAIGDSSLIPKLLANQYPLNTTPRLLPKQLWKRLQVRFFDFLRGWVRGRNDDGENESLLSAWSAQHRAMALTLGVISAWWSWRNSGKLLKLVKHLLRMAASPARELLEAFIPRSRQIHNQPA